jgi:hypothetical protein
MPAGISMPAVPALGSECVMGRTTTLLEPAGSSNATSKQAGRTLPDFPPFTASRCQRKSYRKTKPGSALGKRIDYFINLLR